MAVQFKDNKRKIDNNEDVVEGLLFAQELNVITTFLSSKFTDGTFDEDKFIDLLIGTRMEIEGIDIKTSIPLSLDTWKKYDDSFMYNSYKIESIDIGTTSFYTIVDSKTYPVYETEELLYTASNLKVGDVIHLIKEDTRVYLITDSGGKINVEEDVVALAPDTVVRVSDTTTVTPALIYKNEEGNTIRLATNEICEPDNVDDMLQIFTKFSIYTSNGLAVKGSVIIDVYDGETILVVYTPVNTKLKLLYQILDDGIYLSFEDTSIIPKMIYLKDMFRSSIPKTIRTPRFLIPETSTGLSNEFRTKIVALKNSIENHYDFSTSSNYYISDGGGDMYDAGNMLWIHDGSAAKRVYYGASSYLQVQHYNNAKYVSYTERGVHIELMDLKTVEYVRVEGGLGADGRGNTYSLDTHLVPVNGWTIYHKYVGGTGDPSINHIWLVNKPEGVIHTVSTNTDLDEDKLTFDPIGEDVQIIYFLFAKASGQDSSASEIQELAKQLSILVNEGLTWQ